MAGCVVLRSLMLWVLASMLLLLQQPSCSTYPSYPPGGSCNVNGPASTLCLAAPFSDNAVLQREPAMAAITGSVPDGYGDGGHMAVTVTLTDESEEDQGRGAAVSAVVRADRTWKALLPPRPAFGNYSITAQCTSGCSGANASYVAALLNLTFGDVYVCAGQSNMQLMLAYTFDVNRSVAAIKQGKYRNIRLFSGPMNFPFATNQSDVYVINADQAGNAEQNKHQLSTGGWRIPANLVETIPGGHNKPPWFNQNEFSKFYATCWYTFEQLTDSLLAAGKAPPPFGLMAVAVGGTKIAQWVEWSAQAACSNVTCCNTIDCTQPPPYPGGPTPYQPITPENCSGNAALYNGLIAPLVNTTVSGWLFYQGQQQQQQQQLFLHCAAVCHIVYVLLI
jgi:hypothetical protein